MPAFSNRSLRYQKPTMCRLNGTPYCLPSTAQPSAAEPIVLTSPASGLVMSITLPERICVASWPPPHCW